MEPRYKTIGKQLGKQIVDNAGQIIPHAVTALKKKRSKVKLDDKLAGLVK